MTSLENYAAYQEAVQQYGQEAVEEALQVVLERLGFSDVKEVPSRIFRSVRIALAVELNRRKSNEATNG